jgi:hypothetical protein
MYTYHGTISMGYGFLGGAVAISIAFCTASFQLGLFSVLVEVALAILAASRLRNLKKN